MKKQIQNCHDLVSENFCSISVVKNDEDFTVLYANHAFYRLIGYTPEAFQRKYAFGLRGLLGAKNTKELRKALADHGELGGIRFTCQIRTGYQGSLWMRSEITLSQMEGQDVLHIISYDINSCKELEHRCQLMEQKLETIFGNTDFDLIEYCRETGEILAVEGNAFFQGLTGTQEAFPDVLISRGLVDKDYASAFLDSCGKIREGESTNHCELRLKATDETYKWAMMTLNTRGSTNASSSTVTAIFNNITAQKEASLQYVKEALFYRACLRTYNAYAHLDVTKDKFLEVGGIWGKYREISDQNSYSYVVNNYFHKIIYADDRIRYLDMLQRSNLLQSFESGITHLYHEFRRMTGHNKMNWTGLTLELFENPINHHIMALLYLKYIDLPQKQGTAAPEEAAAKISTNLHSKTSGVFLAKKYLFSMPADVFCASVIIHIRNIQQCTEEQITQRIFLLTQVLHKAFRRSDIIFRLEKAGFYVLVKDVKDIRSVERRLEYILREFTARTEDTFTLNMGVAYSNCTITFEQLLDKSSAALKSSCQKGPNTYYTCPEAGPNAIDLPYDEENIEDVPAFASTLTGEYTNEFAAFIDEYGEIAYLVDPESYELLCGNKAFYDRLSTTPAECSGKKCYELLHHRTHPCPFCGYGSWSFDSFHMYRNYNEVLEQEFLIKNKLVQWHNQKILLAIAVDLTCTQGNSLDTIENGITEDRALLNAIRNMQIAEDLPHMLNIVLETIGDFFHAGSVLYWKLDNEHSCELNLWWTSKEQNSSVTAPSKSERMQIGHWLHNRKWSGEFRAETREAMLCSSFELYNRMEKLRCQNQTWIALEDSNHSAIGFIEINDTKTNYHNTSFLHTLLTFLEDGWKKRTMVEELIHVGYYDKLTNLLNRPSYDKYLSSYSESSISSMGVILLDINGLKYINETLGMQTGNSYIIQLSNALRKSFPGRDIYRLSGDEFLVVLPNSHQRDVETGISILQEIISDLGLFTVSIGYAWDTVEKEFEDLVDYATQSMKVNKARYYTSLKHNTTERDELLDWVLSTIEQKNMLLYLQPKIDIRTGVATGAEALVRYRTQHGEIVPPGKFIPSLEKNNLIRYVDLFIFEEVCRLLESWQAKNLPCPCISLNFSRITLAENDLMTTIEGIFNSYNIQKEYIQIEITESYEDIGKALLNQATRNLGTAGYSIALDDFGTKFTNLTILSQIDVQTLKIDRSLVQSLETDKKVQLILKNIIQMCHDLNIEIVAEGVETTKQEQVLKKMGCHLIQGYLYSKPISIDEFEKRFL